MNPKLGELITLALRAAMNIIQPPACSESEAEELALARMQLGLAIREALAILERHAPP